MQKRLVLLKALMVGDVDEVEFSCTYCTQLVRGMAEVRQDMFRDIASQERRDCCALASGIICLC